MVEAAANQPILRDQVEGKGYPPKEEVTFEMDHVIGQMVVARKECGHKVQEIPVTLKLFWPYDITEEHCRQAVEQVRAAWEEAQTR